MGKKLQYIHRPYKNNACMNGYGVVYNIDNDSLIFRCNVPEAKRHSPSIMYQTTTRGSIHYITPQTLLTTLVAVTVMCEPM